MKCKTRVNSLPLIPEDSQLKCSHSQLFETEIDTFNIRDHLASSDSCHTMVTNESFGSPDLGIMTSRSPALSSYFRSLSQHANLINSTRVVIVVDNAHTPLSCEHAKSGVDGDEDFSEFSKRPSHHISDFPELSFTPPFLMEDQDACPSSRWASFNASSSPDMPLSIPRRTCDEGNAQVVDKIADTDAHKDYTVAQSQLSPPLKPRRYVLRHNLCMDATLRQGSRIELSPHSSSQSSDCDNTHCFRSISLTRKRSHTRQFCLVHDDDDLPSLRSLDDIAAQNEPNPQTFVRSTSDETIDRFAENSGYSFRPYRPSNASECHDRWTKRSLYSDEGEEMCTVLDDMLSGDVFDRWGALSPKRNFKAQMCLSSPSSSDMETVTSTDPSIKKLSTHASPSSLVDFPFLESLVRNSRRPKELCRDSVLEILESTGRILGISSDDLHIASPQV